MSAYAEQMQVVNRQEEIQKGLEECGDDMDKMSTLLDELQVYIYVALCMNLSAGG